MGTKQEDPEVQRKAHRAILLLYWIMILGIALPIGLWWWLGRH